jgi:hypothetical protein
MKAFIRQTRLTNIGRSSVVMNKVLFSFFFRLYQTDGRIVHHESSAPSGLGVDTDGVAKYFIVDSRQISDDRPKSCCNVVTSFATFF